MKKKILSLAVFATLVGAAAAQAGSIEFTGVVTPSNDTEKRTVLSSQFANVDGEIATIGYNTILRSGDVAGKGVFGQLVDVDQNDLYAEDGSLRISNSNDFSSLLPTKKGLFMVSHFESRPGAMYLSQLDQDEDGKLTATKTRVLDFADIYGGWVHCAGSVTPWNTHLGSEGYEPNAKARQADGSINSYYNAMAAYYGYDLLALNPYWYGYNIEVAVDSFQKATVTKHYAMGRVAIELAYVMPDGKTAYISDDGTNVGLFRFEADNAGDLSAGTLYAAKYNETSTEGMGAANISWVDLGYATNAQVEAYLGLNEDGSLQTAFTDIFHVGDTDGEGCADMGDGITYTSINTTMGHECLAVKDGMETAASRMETRRYAAMLGATTEWRKMEGITYNPDTHQMYLAMSSIEKGMMAGDSNDFGGHNHINLDTKNKCGGVYALDLDENYDATNIHGVIAGIPVSGDSKNTCDLNGLANPDNISYIPGYNTMIIGEDTGSGHQNDIIWAYDVPAGKLTRIQTTPYGSETTSPYVYTDINGFGYIMSVIQHPYGESDGDELIVGSGDERGYTGYVGPFPSLTK